MRCVLAAAVLSTAAAGTVAHATVAPARAMSLGRLAPADSAASTDNPRHNIPAKPDYFDVCASRGFNDPTCIKQAVAAIEHARSHEHMVKHALILPRNYAKLTVAEQTFVITDLERVDRGLRPLQGLSVAVNAVAHIAAVLQVDPELASSLLRNLHIATYGSNWAGDLGPLSADYDWMYVDGYAKHGGINLACVRPGQWGCWGHRTNILSTYGNPSRLFAGAGTAKPAGASIAEVMTGGSGAAPAYAYTWQQALRHGANGHKVRHR